VARIKPPKECTALQLLLEASEKNKFLKDQGQKDVKYSYLAKNYSRNWEWVARKILD
jgi:hypothetical protein